MIQLVTSCHDLGFAGNHLCALLRKPPSQWTRSDGITALRCLQELSPKVARWDCLQFKHAVQSALTQTTFGARLASSPLFTCAPRTFAGER